MEKATVIAALVTLREQLEELEGEAIEGRRAAVGDKLASAYLRGKWIGLENAAELVRDLTGRIERGWVEKPGVFPHPFSLAYRCGVCGRARFECTCTR